SENRKKLLPSRRYSRHGSTIAPRFLTTQSVKMNRPRDETHIQIIPSSSAIATTPITAGMIHGATFQSRSPCRVARYFQSPFPRRPSLLKCPQPAPPPQLPLMNAANAIVSHFATSNGRNKTIFIHSNAARNGAMISICGAVPFTARISLLPLAEFKLVVVGIGDPGTPGVIDIDRDHRSRLQLSHATASPLPPPLPHRSGLAVLETSPLAHGTRPERVVAFPGIVRNPDRRLLWARCRRFGYRALRLRCRRRPAHGRFASLAADRSDTSGRRLAGLAAVPIPSPMQTRCWPGCVDLIPFDFILRCRHAPARNREKRPLRLHGKYLPEPDGRRVVPASPRQSQGHRSRIRRCARRARTTAEPSRHSRLRRGRRRYSRCPQPATYRHPYRSRDTHLRHDRRASRNHPHLLPPRRGKNFSAPRIRRARDDRLARCAGPDRVQPRRLHRLRFDHQKRFTDRARVRRTKRTRGPGQFARRRHFIFHHGRSA